MARRTVDPIVLAFTIATPAATLQAAPQSTVLAVQHGILEAVDVTIPPGHAGQTGVQLQQSGQVILPWGGGAPWIIGDDLAEQFPVDFEVDRGLTAVTYNEGVYPHNHYLRLRIRLTITTGPPPAVALIPTSALNAN